MNSNRNNEIKKFYDCALGTRFKYTSDSSDTWVILDRAGFGLIAKWQGVDLNKFDQSICSFEETEEATKNTLVYIIE